MYLRETSLALWQPCLSTDRRHSAYLSHNLHRVLVYLSVCSVVKRVICLFAQDGLFIMNFDFFMTDTIFPILSPDTC